MSSFQFYALEIILSQYFKLFLFTAILDKLIMIS